MSDAVEGGAVASNDSVSPVAGGRRGNPVLIAPVGRPDVFLSEFVDDRPAGVAVDPLDDAATNQDRRERRVGRGQ